MTGALGLWHGLEAARRRASAFCMEQICFIALESLCNVIVTRIEPHACERSLHGGKLLFLQSLTHGYLQCKSAAGALQQLTMLVTVTFRFSAGPPV